MPVIEQQTEAGFVPLLDDGINTMFADFSASRFSKAGETVTIRVTLPLTNGNSVQQILSVESPLLALSTNPDALQREKENIVLNIVHQNFVVDTPNTYK